MSDTPVVVAVVGLTGTGKTELAAELARRIDAEVIGADSMQVYRGMDIGTAKPSRALRAEIPHHAIDVVDPDDEMSAGRYASLARRAAADVLARGRHVILCGGTGLYARAFAGGLIESVEAQPELRAELEGRSTIDLLRELRERDPQAALRIPGGDRVRLLRALEIAQLGGRPASELRAEHGFADRPYPMRWLGLDLPRDLLEPRIRSRVDAMFEAGLVEEVRALHAQGYTRALRPLNAIGYREVGLLLDGVIDEDEARSRIAIATRRYAKRQRTWFRAQPDLRWLRGQGAPPDPDEALRLLDLA